MDAVTALSPTEPVPALVDAARIATLRRDAGAELLAELVEIFAHELPGSLRAIDDASGGEALFCAAHRLKGASATLGAGELAARCQRIEDRARAGELEEARAAARGLPALAERTVHELRRG
jgi:HPt (histidine-containing phosphotransfer) domain-containing protein